MTCLDSKLLGLCLLFVVFWRLWLYLIESIQFNISVCLLSLGAHLLFRLFGSSSSSSLSSPSMLNRIDCILAWHSASLLKRWSQHVSDHWFIWGVSKDKQNGSLRAAQTTPNALVAFPKLVCSYDYNSLEQIVASSSKFT